MGAPMLQILKLINMCFEKVLITKEIMPFVVYAQDAQHFQMNFG